MSSKQLILYAPVIHRGVEQFIEKELPADEILIVGQGFSAMFEEIGKEIRAVNPGRIADDLRGRYHGPNIRVVEPAEWPGAAWADEIAAASDEITTSLVSQLSGKIVRIEPVFLRWDRHWAKRSRPAEWDGEVTADEFTVRMMGEAVTAADQSSDWWRQVGAVVRTADDTVLSAFNRHRPTEQAPYIDGDPRNAFSRGVSIELSTSLHGERAIIARAARDGISLRGASWWVTTFPCPVCAQELAETAASELYFAGGYSMLDGERVLRDAGVRLVWVDLDKTTGRSRRGANIALEEPPS